MKNQKEENQILAKKYQGEMEQAGFVTKTFSRNERLFLKKQQYIIYNKDE